MSPNNIQINQVFDPSQIDMSLLLEADPSEAMIDSYIIGAKVFNAEIDGLLVATYVPLLSQASRL